MIKVVEMVGVVRVVEMVSKRLHKRFQSWWLGWFGTEEVKRPKKVSRLCRKRLVKIFFATGFIFGQNP